MATGKPVLKTNSNSARFLRKTLEQSLAALAACEEPTGETQRDLLSRSRSMPLRIAPSNFKQRALSDAATALRALWKTSRTA
jgi:hypothetical protein